MPSEELVGATFGLAFIGLFFGLIMYIVAEGLRDGHENDVHTKTAALFSWIGRSLIAMAGLLPLLIGARVVVEIFLS